LVSLHKKYTREGRMGIEEEIRKLLLKGKTPRELIQMGYKKPSVYKVNKLLNQGSIRETYSLWCIENIRFNQDRYQPGQTGTVTFELKNTSDTDLYVYRVGIQPEWLKEKWFAINSRVLLHPLEKKQFGIKFDIPQLPFDEYGIRFGMEGQYLYPSIRGIKGEQYIQWSEPVFINIKMPQTGYKVFISHSVKDIFLIRQLAKHLDNYGVDVIIAEDIRTPGVKLDDKFYGLIRESHLVLGILTKNGVNSEWVKKEINYAYKLNKPIIPLVEEGIQIRMSIEYVPFSLREPIESILHKIKDGFNKIKEKKIFGQDITKVIVPILIAGLAGILVGLLLAGSGKRS